MYIYIYIYIYIYFLSPPFKYLYVHCIQGPLIHAVILAQTVHHHIVYHLCMFIFF